MRLTPRRLRWLTIALHAALFLGAVCLYTLTLNGDVQPADSGEFQIAAITLGIPHPPGYPLYTMLAWLMTQIPIGLLFARVSFLSVLAAAGTLVLVSLSVQNLTIRLWATNDNTNSESNPHLIARVLSGLLAAFALGTSTTFWAQATTTNIRSLTAFFTALIVFAMARLFADYLKTRSVGAANLCLFGVAIGLGVGHHVSLVFISVILSLAVSYWVIRSRTGYRVLVSFIIFLIAAQIVWLYLPLRDAAGARFAPGNLTTLDGLLFHIFARGFAGDMLAFAAPAFLTDRLAILPTLFAFEFSSSILILSLFGTIVLLFQRRLVDVMLLAALVVHTFITITYRAPQTVEYAIPSWVILTILLGCGSVALFDLAYRIVSRVITRLHFATNRLFDQSLILIVLMTFGFVSATRDAFDRLPGLVALNTDHSMRAVAEDHLASAEPNSTILSQWHQATPMWALQDVEGRHRNVRVEYVYPHGAQPYAETFAEQAKNRERSGTVYATSLFESEFRSAGLQALPVGIAGLWQLLPATMTLATDTVTDSFQFDNHIEVAGVVAVTDEVKVGQSFTVRLKWKLTKASTVPEAITVRIMRRDGRLATNADIAFDPADPVNVWHPAQVKLAMPLDLTPGSYEVVVGAYRSESSGFLNLLRTDDGTSAQHVLVRVYPSSQPPITMHPLSIAVAGGAVLLGADYDTGIAGKWRLLTHWKLPGHPITVTVANAAGAAAAPPQNLPEARDTDGYFTLIYDIEPAIGLHVGVSDSPAQISLPDGRAGERYIPFADQIVLTGVSTVRGAGQLKVDVEWLANQSLQNDYIVSARVMGDGFSAAHDSVPALGALPTLKWIRGSQVWDRHPFDLDQFIGKLRGAIVVYDSATRELIPALDERYENGVTFDVN